MGKLTERWCQYFYSISIRVIEHWQIAQRGSRSSVLSGFQHLVESTSVQTHLKSELAVLWAGGLRLCKVPSHLSSIIWWHDNKCRVWRCVKCSVPWVCTPFGVPLLNGTPLPLCQWEMLLQQMVPFRDWLLPNCMPKTEQWEGEQHGDLWCREYCTEVILAFSLTFIPHFSISKLMGELWQIVLTASVSQIRISLQEIDKKS